MRIFQARYPQNFGVTGKLLFRHTDKGYCAKVEEGVWIGMPKNLVEKNPHLFKELKKPNYGTSKENVGRDRTSPQTKRPRLY